MNNSRFEKLSEDFKSYIKEKKSRAFTTSYGYRSSDYTSIYFYPWSKVVGNAATYFSTIDKFVSQMEEWGIEVSKVQKELLKKNNISYCVCKPNCKELLIRDKYIELRNALEEYETPSPSYVPKVYNSMSEDDVYTKFWNEWD